MELFRTTPFTPLARLAAGLCLLACTAPQRLQAQLTPEITAWYLNTSGYTGYAGLEADCQQVQYSAGFVYVGCSGIPAYSIGPWQMNPNTPSDQNYVFKIPRNPVENTGVKTATALGNIAVLVNGVTVFNALDAMSYNNQGIWHQDANHFEAASFDASGGHPAPGGRYHYHRRPLPLCPNSSATHSAIIGYSFDGFPIYGPFGYSDPQDAGSAITRIQSSYRLRNITQRTTLPDGTVLQPNQYGPAVGGQYPLGAYIEDYEYVAGLGDVDEYNGRLCKTPEYPNGIYAYFATTDNGHNATYPYFIGPEYYGTVETANVGPQGGHVTITEPTTVWTGATATVDEIPGSHIQAYPNPATAYLMVKANGARASLEVTLLDAMGVQVRATQATGGDVLSLPVTGLPAGIYFLQGTADGQAFTHKVLVRPGR